MHFSLPTSTKSSNLWTPRSSPTSSKSAYLTHIVKRRRRTLYIILFVALACLLFFYSRADGAHRAAMKTAPTTVLVVAVDKASMTTAFQKKIVENRKRYAERWGYNIFVRDIGEYAAGNEYQFKDAKGKVRTYEKTFNKLPLVRHAMATYPYTQNFWFLSSNSLIINMDLSLEDHILNRKRLNSLMLRNQPVIPPESIIHTFKRTDADEVQFIITQDSKSVRSDSFIVRRKRDEMPGRLKPGKTVFGYYLFDLWFDPLYRFYHFGKAETSALEHMIQWHPTVLAKLAIIPQRIMLSYPLPTGGNAHTNDKREGKDGTVDKDDVKNKYAGSGYEPGDFVVHFEGCSSIEKDKGCSKEFERYWKMTEAGKGKGKGGRSGR
ncbi:hypothetical protein ABW19_dt0201005 [Dactylella cylindrospora]|nr:hypothetical protein ABW19_dt0201005 [Dactylella cylindrospora]